MEKDIDRISKNPDTDIVIRIDDYAGKRGVTIREFVKGERYTGFTKAGTRIPADKFKHFKTAINSIREEDLVPSEADAEYSNEPPKHSQPRGQYSQKSPNTSSSQKPSAQKEATSQFTDVKEEAF